MTRAHVLQTVCQITGFVGVGLADAGRRLAAFFERLPKLLVMLLGEHRQQLVKVVVLQVQEAAR